MGVRSDVALIVTEELHTYIHQNAPTEVIELLDEADKKIEKENEVLYFWDNVEWYDENEEYKCNKLHKLLESRDDEYYLLKLTPDYVNEGYSPVDTYGSYEPDYLGPSVNISVNIPEDAEVKIKQEERKFIGNVVVDSGQLFITDPCYLVNGGWKDEDDPGVKIIGLNFWGEGQEDIKTFLEEKCKIMVEKRGSAYFVPVDNEADYYKLKRLIYTHANIINKIVVATKFTDASYHLISDVTLTSDAGEALYGVAFTSGLGDGIYPVYATFREIDGWGKRITKVEIELISDEEIKTLEGDDE
jgi:hypothetical protein